MRRNPWLTAADLAEIDAVAHALEEMIREHRKSCSICSARCEEPRRIKAAFAEWDLAPLDAPLGLVKVTRLRLEEHLATCAVCKQAGQPCAPALDAIDAACSWIERRVLTSKAEAQRLTNLILNAALRARLPKGGPQ